MNVKFPSKFFTLLASAVLMAATTLPASAQNCDDPRVDRAECKREAGAAAQAKQQGKLNSPGGYSKNALKRCNNQPEGAARDACVKRVTGAGDTKVRGSVKGGGKLRMNEMPVPAADAPKQ